MATYFEVLNDNSKLAIDDSFVNLRFVTKYNVDINIQGPFGQNFRTGTLNITGIVNPVIAIYSTSIGVCMFKMVNESNGSYTYTFQAGEPNTNTTITVYVFDNSLTQGNFGLQTFDASGKLCFDSSLRYMKVSGIATFSNYDTAVLPTLSQGSYAFVVSGAFSETDEYHDSYETGEAFAVTNIWRYMIKSTPTGATAKTVNVFNMRTGVGITTPFNHSVRAGSILFIDITGL
ncbi:hypothetical protein vBAbaPP1_46 [Acinetobacter phage vB_AbaM_P1]|nr:hypothetical protein vBAbaPP1_46 [Acinetobacter phage vB_AbaM_P1]